MAKKDHKPTSREDPKKKMAPRGGNSPVIGDNGFMLSEGDASKAAEAMVDILLYDDMFGELFRSIKSESDVLILRSTKLDLDNIDSLKRRFVGYVANCIIKDERFGNLMVYRAIGINKGTAYDWEHGRARGKEYSDFIKNVKEICGAYREYLALYGLVNPVTTIFWEKVHDGFVETQQINVVPIPYSGKTLEELSREYPIYPEE